MLGDIIDWLQIEFIVTRPDISFPVSVVSQFLDSPIDTHWDVVIRVVKYLKSATGSTPGQPTV